MADVLCFDIDGVITLDTDMHYEDIPGSYVYRKINLRVKALITKAIKAGWTVILFTGRQEEQRRLTENWLALNGVHYHFLFMGKPYFTYIVDDRSRSVDQIEQMIDNDQRRIAAED